MTTSTHIDWLGATVFDSTGDKIGDITDIYMDDATGQPEWLTVSTGWFGTKEQFVPIAGSKRGAEGGLVVPYTTDQIKDAPSIDTDEDHLSAEEESRLYGHYGLNFNALDHEATYGGRERADEGFEFHDTRAAHAASDHAEMTRSEEQLAVDKVEQGAGRVRLHKYVVTDDVEFTVPVKRQVARIVRTDATGAGVIVGDSVEEIVLTEEQVVVDKQVVAKETVAIETDTVVDEALVSETLRKEQVVIDGDVETT